MSEDAEAMVAEPARIDPFFSGLEDTQWNACIGPQGTDENYVDGYIEAAIELADAIIEKKKFGSRDTLVLPLLYTARHGLELALKYAISRLYAYGVLSEAHKVDHDVQSHWKLLKEANLGDRTLRKLVDDLEPFVISLAQIDDDGQALRYATTRDGDRSLSDRPLANIRWIRAGVTAMGSVLEALKVRVIQLEEERSTGCYTVDCSRRDLRAIADRLPPAADWAKPAFALAKAAIMEDYGLGSRRFSAAVDKIKTSRELRAQIGLATNLSYLQDHHLILAMEQWALRHPPRVPTKGLGLDYFGTRDWDAMSERDVITGQVNAAILKALSADEIADLTAVFLIGREQWFCEHYEEVLARERLAMGDRVWEKVNYLTEKTNLRSAVTRGLAALGRPDLANQVKDLAGARPAEAI